MRAAITDESVAVKRGVGGSRVMDTGSGLSGDTAEEDAWVILNDRISGGTPVLVISGYAVAEGKNWFVSNPTMYYQLKDDGQSFSVDPGRLFLNVLRNISDFATEHPESAISVGGLEYRLLLNGMGQLTRFLFELQEVAKSTNAEILLPVAGEGISAADLDVLPTIVDRG